ncbi:MAG TPA: STAS domain-containing protein [Candidatus Cybelea sp.]|jgi:anti-anti-sigma factor|nr:STAS domain-containing protein [Candidatus Cybelea sp.]
MASHTEPLVIIFEQSEWDLSSRDDLKRLLEPARTHPNVILDMSLVTFADSTALQALINLRQERAAANFEPARIVAHNPQIRRLFKMLGLDSVWSLYMSLEDALTDMQLSREAGDTNANSSA